jgi:hypothetical protein
LVSKDRPVQAWVVHQPYYYLTRSKPTVSRSSTFATLIPQEKVAAPNNNDDDDGPRVRVLDILATVAEQAKEYANTFGFTDTEATVYAVFTAIRKAKIPLGLGGALYVLYSRSTPQCMG